MYYSEGEKCCNNTSKVDNSIGWKLELFFPSSTTRFSLKRRSLAGGSSRSTRFSYRRTKHRLSWKFKINNELHELICTVSKLSGKRMVVLDGNSLIEAKR